MGSSSPSTVTQTTNNIPFNSGQLSTVENDAINLMGSNPLSYYPGQTYASPNSTENNALSSAGNMGQAAGDALSSYTPGAQQASVANNTWLSNGGAQTGIQNLNGQLVGLGSSNPSSSAISALTPFSNGSLYASQQPAINHLSGLATNSQAGQGLYGLTNGTAASGLQGLTNGTAATGLQGVTNGTAAQGLAGLGAGQGTSAQTLANEANGAYLNSNPNLASMYNAAADAVTRQYQNATAPQTASAFEAAGRTNSGAAQQAQSVNQQNLGDTLGNLAANIYGTDYANERGLQNSAATSLGSLQSGALSNLGSLQNSAYSNLGSLQNSAYSNLGSLQNSALSNLGSLDQTSQNNALSQAASQMGLMSNAASNAGQLGISGTNAQENALNAGTGNVLNSYGLQQNAINSTPALTNQGYTDYQTALNAGTQQTTNAQNALNDTENRYYGNEYAPYQTLDQAASVVGGAIPGMTSSQVPYFQPSGASQVLGGLAGAGSLGNTLFGSSAGGLVGALK